jgi:hypothetical protein
MKPDELPGDPDEQPTELPGSPIEIALFIPTPALCIM